MQGRVNLTHLHLLACGPNFEPGPSLHKDHLNEPGCSRRVRVAPEEGWRDYIARENGAFLGKVDYDLRRSTGESRDTGCQKQDDKNQAGCQPRSHGNARAKARSLICTISDRSIG